MELARACRARHRSAPLLQRARYCTELYRTNVALKEWNVNSVSLDGGAYVVIPLCHVQLGIVRSMRSSHEQAHNCDAAKVSASLVTARGTAVTLQLGGGLPSRLHRAHRVAMGAVHTEV